MKRRPFFTMKHTGIGLVVLTGLVLAMALVYRIELLRLYRVMHMFEPDVIQENFRSMHRIFDSRVIPSAREVFPLDRAPRPLAGTYTYGGQTKTVMDWMDRTETTGLIVLHQGRIAFEEYFRGNTPHSQCISWSVGKSFVSALVGFALEEGRIRDLMDPVTAYAPFLKGSGYDGVPLKHVLQMSSGIGFNEKYADFNSDINRMGRVFALSLPMEEFVASLKNTKPPGTWNHYVSMDTQVLGMVLKGATGKPLSAYLSEKIWQPLGMEAEAFWVIDSRGMELAFGTLNIILRDYARFGQFYLDEGRNWKGEQLLSREWIRASVTPDAPHLMPGRNNPASTSILGYGYQWWLPEESDGDYSAIGVYGQFIYVNPKCRVVIAKTSAYTDYNNTGNSMEYESLAVFRAIAEDLKRQSLP